MHPLFKWRKTAIPACRLWCNKWMVRITSRASSSTSATISLMSARRTTSSVFARRFVRLSPSNISKRHWRPVPSLSLRPAGSLHPFGLGISHARGPYLSDYRRAFAFSGFPLPPSAIALPHGRVSVSRRDEWGLTLLLDWELRPGRLRPFVRRELLSPSLAEPSSDPTRLPFGSGHQPLGPVLR